MIKKTNKKSLYTKVVLIFFAISIVTLWLGFSNHQLSDSKLKYDFGKNRLKFNKILNQFKNDNSIDILRSNSSRSYKSGNNLEYERYQQEMEQLGLTEVFNDINGKKVIWFVASSTLLNGRKGYVYITDSEYKKHIAFYVIASTDNKGSFPRDGDGSSDTFYVPIEENWYIFYEEFGD